MGLKSVRTKEKEEKLIVYVIEMGRLAHPLAPNDLKFKVAEICQIIHTSFRDGI